MSLGSPAATQLRAHTRLRDWVIWFGVLALVTVGMLSIRAQLDKAHVALILLLVVLGASGAAGRLVGLSVVAVAFVLFNFFFLPPYATLAIYNPLDWLVLLVFLATSVVAAQLLHRSRREAQEAEERAAEVDRLATLGAETLNAPDAHDGLQAIVEVIRTALGVDECDVFERDAHLARLAATSRAGVGDESHADATKTGEGSLVGWILTSGRRAVELSDGTVRVSDGPVTDADVRAIALPLQVRGAVVGVLRVARRSGLRQGAEWHRMLDALAYYAALGVERVRLTTQTEHAEAERRLETLRSALLTSVSHDLRTPLTTIKGLAHEIGQGGSTQIAVEIEAEADRLNTFIGDMLEFSRIQSGAVRPIVAMNTADELVGAALQQARSVLRGRTVTVDASPDEMLSGKFAFSESLRVLVNLLENAAKYAPSGTPIVVRVRRDGDWLTIGVLDEGPGVPPAERDRIFEPFYRPAKTPSDVGGTGLGLSIARGLAEAQGGQLRYEARDGRGSAFILSLPVAEEPELTR
jgi:two-component system, OmpR family, sensor histidine kinase KdpD